MGACDCEMRKRSCPKQTAEVRKQRAHEKCAVRRTWQVRVRNNEREPLTVARELGQPAPELSRLGTPNADNHSNVPIALVAQNSPENWAGATVKQRGCGGQTRRFSLCRASIRPV